MSNVQIKQLSHVAPVLTDDVMAQAMNYVTKRFTLAELAALIVPGGVLPAWAGISAYRSTNQTYTSGSWQKWLIDTAIGAPVNWSLGGNRLTCGIDGRYLVQAHLTYDTQGDNIVYAAIYKNGVAVRYCGNGIGNGAAFYGARVLHPSMELVAGDYIEIYGRQDSGVNKTLPGQAAWAHVDVSRVA